MSLRQRPPISNTPPSTTTSPPNDVVADQLPPPPPPLPPPPTQSVLSQALESSGHLANLLPTGTLLAFQILNPIFTNNGSCDSATRPMTLVLLTIFVLSCFLASFTDSVKSSSDGRVYYGLVTLKGLWLFDNSGGAAAGGLPELSKYRLSFIDVVHAVLSVLVFVAVALRDKNVVSCFYPMPDHEAQEVLDIVPIGIGFIASLLFVAFPTKRHGIGYPVTPDNR